MGVHSAAGNTDKPDQRQRLHFVHDIIHNFTKKCNCDYFSTREILSPHSRDFVPPIFLKAALQACFRGYQKAVSSVRYVRTLPAIRPPLQTGAALPIIDLRAAHDRKTLEKEKPRAAEILFFQGYLTEARADRLHAHKSHYKARRAVYF